MALTSMKTSLPKTMRGCGDLVKLLLAMPSPSQVISTDAIMKSKSNKWKLAGVIGIFNLAEINSVKTDNGRFRLNEADMAIVLI